VRSGSSFTGYVVAAGVLSLSGTGAIEATAAAPALRGLTTASARLRDASADAGEISLRLNVDRAGGLVAPVVVALKLQSNGTQQLTLRTATADGPLSTVFTCSNLPAALITVRLMADPSQGTVNLRVNDSEMGTFGYYRRAVSASAGDARGAVLSLDAGGSAEVDFLTVRGGRAQ
jgi:hypothetical protein